MRVLPRALQELGDKGNRVGKGRKQEGEETATKCDREKAKQLGRQKWGGSAERGGSVLGQSIWAMLRNASYSTAHAHTSVTSPSTHQEGEIKTIPSDGSKKRLERRQYTPEHPGD